MFDEPRIHKTKNGGPRGWERRTGCTLPIRFGSFRASPASSTTTARALRMGPLGPGRSTGAGRAAPAPARTKGLGQTHLAKGDLTQEGRIWPRAVGAEKVMARD